MPPLVIQNQNIGQRHYFECFESAIGGIISENLNEKNTLYSLYSIPDAFALQRISETNYTLLSRCFDLNTAILDHYGFELLEFSDFNTFINIRPADKNFLLIYDEFYVKENNNFNRNHFIHASLVKEILNNSSFIVSDPQLKIRDTNGYDDRCISFTNISNTNGQKCLFYLLNVKSAKEANQKILTNIFEIQNMSNWKHSSEKLSFFVGLDALNQYLELFRMKIFVTDFYKWIFPLYWRREYFNKKQEKEIVQLLNATITEMEIFETHLLRLNVKFSQNLYSNSEIRIIRIIELIEKYLFLVEKKIIDQL
jgi:hypothetical protein